MSNLNERFTDFADTVSEGMGRWWVTAISFVLIGVWLAAGPFFHWSNTWQLLVNTPTTIVELWIGFLIAANTNRVERHARLLQHQDSLLQDRQLIIMQHVEQIAQHMEQVVEQQEILRQQARAIAEKVNGGT